MISYVYKRRGVTVLKPHVGNENFKVFYSNRKVRHRNAKRLS